MIIFRNISILLMIGSLFISTIPIRAAVSESNNDTTKFTLGCLAKQDCWSNGVIDAIYDVVCEPLFKSAFDYNFYRQMVYDDESVKYLCGEDQLPCFKPFTQDDIDNDLADKPGDTVTIIWVGGSCKGVIDNIGLACNVMGIEPVCQIKAINKDLSGYSLDNCFAVVLRQNKSYNGPLIKYYEYRPPIDENLTLLLDSLIYDEARAWIRGKVYSESLGMAEIQNAKGEIRYTKFVFYSRNLDNRTPDNAKPDTFYCNVICCGNININSFMMYRLIRIGNIYKAQALFDDYGMAHEFKLLCMIDANSDGKMEFIVKQSEEFSVTFKIYNEINGKWIRLFEGCHTE